MIRPESWRHSGDGPSGLNGPKRGETAAPHSWACFFNLRQLVATAGRAAWSVICQSASAVDEPPSGVFGGRVVMRRADRFAPYREEDIRVQRKATRRTLAGIIHEGG